MDNFKWGKKRETKAETNKGVQFYESFTFGDSQYSLYDCVLVPGATATATNSPQFFVGKIISMWEEHNDQLQNPRKIKLLWFFKPSEISLHLHGVENVLPNELFLASGTGIGLTNDNPLESIYGKCSVICTSKDLRNPQPSDEQIKSADFLFHRTFDVGTCNILEKIDDNIAGVDVKFIFNRTSCERKVKKVSFDIRGTADSLKQNLPSTSGSVLQNERNAHRKSDYGYKKKEYDDCNKRQASKKVSFREESSNKDYYGRRDGEFDCDNAFASRRNICNETKHQENDVPRRNMTDQRSRLAEEKCGKELDCLDDLPQKKRKLHGDYVAVSDGRTKTSHDSRKGIEHITSPKDKVSAGEAYSKQPSFRDKKQDLRVQKISEGQKTKPATENGLLEKPNDDCKISKHTEGKTLTGADYKRNYEIFQVTRKPDAEETKWYRDLPWEENLRCAEGQGKLVHLQNLDPTYTSSEVEDIVYSALNEQCTARMIERTSATIPHIGEALVIFKTVDAAKRVLKRLNEGCLMLPNRRPLVASIAKVNPPGKPSSRFTGHIKTRTQMRRGMRDAVATSHASQVNTIEFDMAMDWRLHRDRFELALEKTFERQIDEKKKLEKDLVKPKRN